eukprot:6208608-Pleurochrysis_carterae.AAC.3
MYSSSPLSGARTCCTCTACVSADPTAASSRLFPPVSTSSCVRAAKKPLKAVERTWAGTKWLTLRPPRAEKRCGGVDEGANTARVSRLPREGLGRRLRARLHEEAF